MKRQKVINWVVAGMGLLVGSLLLANSTDAARKPPKPIREYDVDTLAKLGREIYQHDQLAWHATDALFSRVDQKQLVSEGAQGWIVDTANVSGALVRFLRKKDDGVEAAYDIVFAAQKKPELKVPTDRQLTEGQACSAQALKTARQAFLAGSYPWCGGNANTVVLNDPDGAGFLVYFLRPKPTMEDVPVGGHYRFTISADGKTVEQVDQLFASCLTLKRTPPAGSGKMVALSVSHVVSKTPLETHVFLSLQERLPFYVITPDSRTWLVDQGKITASK